MGVDFGLYYTLQDWINARDLFLMACKGESLPDDMRVIYRERARLAAGKVRQAMREIESLEQAFDLPAFENESYKIRD